MACALNARPVKQFCLNIGVRILAYFRDPIRGRFKTQKPKTFVLGLLFVGAAGFEPAAPWSQTRCATGLRHAPNNIFVK
jgi:hypothetical protein